MDQKIPNIVMRAYYGMPEKTAEDFRNLKLHTGDLGRMDADGYVYFMDRVKDYIRRRGENVSSMEVEKQVSDHPGVREAAAIGVKAGEGASSEDEIMIVCVAEGAAPDPVGADALDGGADAVLHGPALHPLRRHAPQDADRARPEGEAARRGRHTGHVRPRGGGHYDRPVTRFLAAAAAAAALLLLAAATASAAVTVAPGWPRAVPGGTVHAGPGGGVVVVTDLARSATVRAFTIRGQRLWRQSSTFGCGNCDDGPQPEALQPDGTYGPIGVEGDDFWAVDARGRRVAGCAGGVSPDGGCVVALPGESIDPHPGFTARPATGALWRVEDPRWRWFPENGVPPMAVGDADGVVYAAFRFSVEIATGRVADGVLMALDPATRTILWQREGPEEALAALPVGRPRRGGRWRDGLRPRRRGPLAPRRHGRPGASRPAPPWWTADEAGSTSAASARGRRASPRSTPGRARSSGGRVPPIAPACCRWAGAGGSTSRSTPPAGARSGGCGSPPAPPRGSGAPACRSGARASSRAGASPCRPGSSSAPPTSDRLTVLVPG